MPKKTIQPLSLEASRTKLLQDFKISCNTVRSLISLKQIHTVSEALERLGYDASKIRSYPPTEIISFEIFKNVEQEIKDQLETQYRVSCALTEYPSPDSLYNVADFLQESSPLSQADEPKQIETPVAQELLSDVISVDKLQTSPEIPSLGMLQEKVSTDSIIPPHNPLQRASLFSFQHNLAKEIFTDFSKNNIRSGLLRLRTGDGKTFVIGQILRWMFDSKFFEGKTLSPFPVFYVTKSSIVEQTRRVIENKFGLDTRTDVIVTNYEQLRAKLGKLVLKEITTVQQGEYFKDFQWVPYMHPCVIVWDESHTLKNETSQHRKVADSFNEIPPHIHTYQIFASATPFSRVSAAKNWVVASRIPFKHGFQGQESPVTNILWPVFSQQIAGDTSPRVYDKASVRRLINVMRRYYYIGKSIKRKHKALNYEEIIPFESPAQELEYKDLVRKYKENKARIEGNPEIKNAALMILVEFQILRMGAELLRAGILAKRMYTDVMNGKATVAACCFKPTIAKVCEILYKDYNVPRKDISLIWGGNDAWNNTDMEKLSPEQIQQTILEATRTPEKVSAKKLKLLFMQLKAEAQGLSELPPELELGTQDKHKRQEEIDRFQRGDSLFCLFTFGAGGAGLSLHHTNEYFEDNLDKYTFDKRAQLWIRKKDNIFVGTRQRSTYLTPPYNEMELEQALGRVPRLTSLSDTEQRILCFKGTHEITVLAICNHKRRCLSVVTGEKTTADQGYVDDNDARELAAIGGSREGNEDASEDEEEDSRAEEVFEEIEQEENK